MGNEVYAEIHCQIHQIKLIHLKSIYNGKTEIETGYCYKCHKEYCEYSDCSPIYWSNYEWLYNENS